MTPERHQRILTMLARRQADLTVCLEKVHKPHNLAAIIRSCDAVGAHYIHAIWETDARFMTPRIMSGSGSQRWTQIYSHDSSSEAIKTLKANKMQVLVTHLSDAAVDYREIDYTQPTAIILGREKHGASDEALALSDQHITIPMVGMVQSLNVSVANAVILYEAMQQRERKGMYKGPCPLPEEEQWRILFEGLHPIYAKACRKKGLPYPRIDEQGEIDAPPQWWHKMQMKKDQWLDGE